MAEAFFDFEAFKTDNFAAIGTRQGVTFSPNAIALVSVDLGGEGLFATTAESPPGTTVLSYATNAYFRLDIGGLIPVGIAGGRLSFEYASPNLEHSVNILNKNGKSLRVATLASTPKGTLYDFDDFQLFDTEIPAGAATIQIGSKATELAIDNLRISVDPFLPLAAETPDILEGTEAADSIDARERSAIVSLPEDSIEAGVRFVEISGRDNGDATILEGGTAVKFIPSIASGTGSFDYTVRFGAGDDTQTAFSTATVTIAELRAIAGFGGNDTLVGTGGGERLDGGAEGDLLRGLAGTDTLEGGPGSDSLFGDGDADRMVGGADNDTLYGGWGDDSLFGDDPNSPDSGGDDVMLGDSGNDLFDGGIGDDTLDGGPDNDRLTGGIGDDVLLGRLGGDELRGDAGNDTLQGDRGPDTLFGGEGNDLFLGGAGPDGLYGGVGNDSLFGGQDDDVIYGDRGNDSLAGDAGADTLRGGAGADSLNYLSPNDGGTQPDRILDFNPAEDLLVFNSEAVAEGGFGLSAVSSETQTLNPLQFLTDTESLSLSGTFPALIYNNLTGELRYDADGSGGGEAIAIAEFSPDETGRIPNLSPERIFLVNPVPFIAPDIPEVRAVEDFASTSALARGTDAADTLSAIAPQPVNIPVLDNDSPAGGLIVADISDITGGEAETLNATTITFTPTLPAPGRGSFIYTASDGTGRDSANVFVDILPVETLDGLGGNDSLIGGGGDEFLSGGDGDDSLFGNRGRDSLSGGSGGDRLYGGVDDDFISGETGDDSLFGGSGGDRLYGGVDDDFIFGEAGEDTLFGGSGGDLLYGGIDDDFIFGETGDDSLFGDRGTDTLQGGDGNDTFAYLYRDQVGEGGGDNIVDFTPGSDRLIFNRADESLDGFGFVQIGTTPENQLGPGQFIRLETGIYQDNIGSLNSPILAYEESTGTLKYDPDGSGAQPAEMVATFDDLPTLSADDIRLVETASEPVPPTLPGSETVAAFALVRGTETNDILVADSPNFTGIPVTVSVPEGSSITDVVGGTVTPLFDAVTSVEFIPTLGGGNNGSFNIVRNGTSTAVTVEILSAIDGLEGDDTIAGSDRNDSLFGNIGNDCLTGASGDDTLQGGEGNDSFAYLSRTQVGEGGGDNIVDFTPGSDRLIFNNETPDGFGFLPIGTSPETRLGPGQLIAVETGTYQDNLSSLSSPILAYEIETGTLKYDPDGSGNQPAEIVGILDNSPPLSVDDIILLGTSTEPISPVTANPDSAVTPDSIGGTIGPDSIATDDFTSGLNAIAIPVLNNDSPAGLTITNLGDIFGGEATILDGGTVVEFTPTLLGETVGSFNYTAGDSSGNTASAEVTIDISAVTTLDGLEGDDFLTGSDLNDSLFGNIDNDTLDGAAGDDTIAGGLGSDFLFGGSGNDIFFYASVDEIRGTEADSILDFETGSDRIQFIAQSENPAFIVISNGVYNPETNLIKPAVVYEQETGQLLYDELAGTSPIAVLRQSDGSVPILDNSSILIL